MYILYIQATLDTRTNYISVYHISLFQNSFGIKFSTRMNLSATLIIQTVNLTQERPSVQNLFRAPPSMHLGLLCRKDHRSDHCRLVKACPLLITRPYCASVGFSNFLLLYCTTAARHFQHERHVIDYVPADVIPHRHSMRGR